jgi:serine/threonine protein kinase
MSYPENNKYSAGIQTNIKETLDAKLHEEAGHRVLNQYTFLKQLGSGSFGVVHLGEDNEKHIKVAIKECSKLKLKKQKQAQMGIIGGRGRGRGARGTMRRVTVSRFA